MIKVDVELTDGADFCVRERGDGRYLVELGAAMEVVNLDDLETMCRQLSEFLKSRVGQ